jgi:hypothetical protein
VNVDLFASSIAINIPRQENPIAAENLTGGRLLKLPLWPLIIFINAIMARQDVSEAILRGCLKTQICFFK